VHVLSYKFKVTITPLPPVGDFAASLLAAMNLDNCLAKTTLIQSMQAKPLNPKIVEECPNPLPSQPIMTT